MFNKVPLVETSDREVVGREKEISGEEKELAKTRMCP